MKYQGMVCLAGNQIWWTWEVEDVFGKVKAGNKTAMKDYTKKQHKQIDDLVVKVNDFFFSSSATKKIVHLFVEVQRDDSFLSGSVTVVKERQGEIQHGSYH